MAENEGAPVSAEESGAGQTEGQDEGQEQRPEGEASGEEVEAGGEQTETPEGEGGEEPPKDEETPAQKRIQELANLRREAENRAKALEQRLNEVEQKFSSQQVEQTVDTTALNAHLGRLREEIDFLRIDGKHLEADLKESERDGLVREYKDWQKQDADRRNRMTAEHQTSQQRQKALKDFDAACVFLAKENGIPDDVFLALGEQFAEIVQSDKVFAREVLETIQHQGPLKAAMLAHERVKTEKGRKEAAAAAERVAKEAAKAKASAVKPAAGGTTNNQALSDDLPIDEWIKRREAQLKR